MKIRIKIKSQKIWYTFGIICTQSQITFVAFQHNFLQIKQWLVLFKTEKYLNRFYKNDKSHSEIFFVSHVSILFIKFILLYSLTHQKKTTTFWFSFPQPTEWEILPPCLRALSQSPPRNPLPRRHRLWRPPPSDRLWGCRWGVGGGNGRLRSSKVERRPTILGQNFGEFSARIARPNVVNLKFKHSPPVVATEHVKRSLSLLRKIMLDLKAKPTFLNLWRVWQMTQLNYFSFTLLSILISF